MSIGRAIWGWRSSLFFYIQKTTYGGIPTRADKVRGIKICEEAIRKKPLRIRPVNSLQERHIRQEPAERVAQTSLIKTRSQTPTISTKTAKASLDAQQYRRA